MRDERQRGHVSIAGTVEGGTAYPEQSYSLLKVSHPQLFVWAVKPAEEGIGNGVIVRLWNMAHLPVEAALEFARPPARAMQTTHIETDVEQARLTDGKLAVPLRAQQMKTFRTWLNP